MRKSAIVCAFTKIMKININPQKINELLTRGVEDIIRKEELEKALKSGKKLKIYLGVDPSSPTVHLGHAVVLRKLRDFQKLGHQIFFLIGDFTGQVGDPSGQDNQRQILSHKQVLENAKTYKAQIAKTLDFKKNSPQIKYNSKWLKKLSFTDISQLASHFTVQQMLERDMFANRYKKGKPISLVEFLYPLMQGYDSVAMDVDMEVGGNDQLFNMLAGRTLMERLKNKTKIVMTFQLLEGPDGRKMSKSYGNVIGVTDQPNNMFGEVMSISDDLIIKYFTLCTDVPLEDIKGIESQLKSGANPRDVKAKLAREIVKIYHGEKAALKAEESFNTQFRDKKIPGDIAEIKIEDLKLKTDDLLVKTKLVSSKSEARRMIEQGGVKINQKKITDNHEIKVETGMIVQIGKRKFIKIK